MLLNCGYIWHIMLRRSQAEQSKGDKKNHEENPDGEPPAEEEEQEQEQEEEEEEGGERSDSEAGEQSEAAQKVFVRRVLTLVDTLPKSATGYAHALDRGYGSVELSEALSDRGDYFVMMVPRHQPSELFKSLGVSDFKHPAPLNAATFLSPSPTFNAESRQGEEQEQQDREAPNARLQPRVSEVGSW